MIVVTAPTGQIGRRVVDGLLAAGKPVRAIARDPAKLADVADRVEIVEGSHADAAVVDRAFAGADALFWLAPPDMSRTLDEAYLAFSRPAAEAVRRHRVGHVVGVTALGRDTPWEDEAGIVTASLRMDDLFRATGAAFRGLAMPSFMDNVAQQLAGVREGVLTGTLDPDRKCPTAATRDIGAKAVEWLTDLSWTGQEDVPVLGPEDLSMNEMAAILSDVIGREVRYQQVPLDAFKQRFLARGMSESVAQGYVDMFRSKNEGMDNLAVRTPATATPTSFRAYCEEELAPLLAR